MGEYEGLVGEYEGLVGEYKGLVGEYKGLVGEYKGLLAEYDPALFISVFSLRIISLSVSLHDTLKCTHVFITRDIVLEDENSHTLPKMSSGHSTRWNTCVLIISWRLISLKVIDLKLVCAETRGMKPVFIHVDAIASSLLNNISPSLTLDSCSQLLLSLLTTPHPTTMGPFHQSHQLVKK